MEEQLKKQSNDSNKINNNEEKDPFIRFIELEGEEREEELKKLHYFVREFNLRIGRSDLND